MIPGIFDNPLVPRIGWALIHFLWQGTLIALALKGAFLFINLRYSGIRYALSLATLIVMALLPAFLLYKTPSASAEIPAVHETLQSDAPITADFQTNIAPINDKEPFTLSLSRYFTPLAPWITLLWIPGMSLLLAKTIGGILQVQRLKRKAAVQSYAGNPASLRNLASRAGFPEVPVMNSHLVSIPTVAGWIKPVVLLPSNINEKIDPAMLTALAAHEFAHIRRRDSFMNLLQTVIEDLFFFHPAAWWVSACIRREREACCDDDAVAICGDALLYARALSQAERFRSSMPVMALNSSPLLQRVRRLTAMKASKSKTSVICVSFFAVSIILIIAAGSVSLAFMPPQDSASETDGKKASPPQKSKVVVVNPDDFIAGSGKAKTDAPPQKPAKSNIIGGISGGVRDGSGKPAPPPPPPKPKVVVVNPNDFIAGSGKAKTDAPPQNIIPGKDFDSKRIRSVDPVFPEEALKNRVTGEVILQLYIDDEGIVSAIKRFQGNPIFAAAAIHAARQWKYTPTLLDGKPIPIIATVSVIFTFDDDGAPKVIY